MLSNNKQMNQTPPTNFRICKALFIQCVFIISAHGSLWVSWKRLWGQIWLNGRNP